MKPAGPWAPLGRSQDRRAHRNMCEQAAHSLPSKKRSNGGLHHASNASVQKQNPQNARRNTLPGEQISRWFLLLSEKLSASNYPGAAQTASSFHSHRWLLKPTVLGQRKTFHISALPRKCQGFLRTLPA